jgi:CRISPR/Cas system type I-B associated protein Csh2 (Cas7 group RAMP superfamily)
VTAGIFFRSVIVQHLTGVTSRIAAQGPLQKHYTTSAHRVTFLHHTIEYTANARSPKWRISCIFRKRTFTHLATAACNANSG